MGRLDTSGLSKNCQRPFRESEDIMDEKPKTTALDVGHTAIKAALSAIPIAGGPAAELFAAIVTPPIVERRDRWIQSIGEELLQLKDTVAGFSAEGLSSNPQFITAVMHATASAARNHQQEKLDALRNAVLNVALSNEPDEDLQQIFFGYIDDLQPWHLRILSFYQNPEEWFRRNQANKPNLEFGAPIHALQTAFPELRSYSELVNQMVKDLHNRGLFGSDSLGGTMTEQGIFASRTTEIGNRFLRFISKPSIR